MDLAKLKADHAQLLASRAATNRMLLELRDKVKDTELSVHFLDGQIHRSAQIITAFDLPVPAVVPAPKPEPAKTPAAPKK